MSSLPSHIDLPGLLAYWPMDGNVDDASGNGFNATATDVSYTAGKVGQSLLMDASIPSKAVVSVPTPDEFKFTYTSSFTVGCWVNVESSSYNEQMILSATSGTGFDQGWLVGLDRGRPWFLMLRARTSPFPPTIQVCTALSSNSIYDLGWKHLCYVFDNNHVDVYVDGVLDVSSDGNIEEGPSYASPNVGLAIGSRYNQFTYDHLHGQIDDLVVYNRALSPEEIIQIMTVPEPDVDNNAGYILLMDPDNLY